MDNQQDFTQGSIPKKMIRFMFPILGALIIQAMYSAVDLLIVGKFGSDAGISAVATGSSIMNVITFTVSSLTTGVTILIGRYLGEKRSEKVGGLIGSAVCFFALLGFILTIALLLFARPLAVLLQAPAAAVDLTALYVRICGAGFLFVTFYNFISSIFRGLGNSKLPLLFVSIACVVNIFGDLLLVAVLKMDVAGAALATIFAQAVSVLLSLLIIKRQKLPFHFSKRDLRFSFEIRRILTIGTPMALQELLTQITFLALCAFINRLGLNASSGYGVAQKIQSFVMLIPSSIMQSMASFVSQNVGAKQEKRAKIAMLYGMGIGAIIGIPIAILVFFRGDIPASLFTDNTAYIEQAADFLRGFSVEAILTAVLFSFIGYFNGHSNSLFVMIQSLAQSFLIRLPMSYLMSIQENASLTWVGLAAPTASVFGILICLSFYIARYSKWGIKRAERRKGKQPIESTL
jgi:putative MATE family efflux protein